MLDSVVQEIELVKGRGGSQGAMKLFIGMEAGGMNGYDQMRSAG